MASRFPGFTSAFGTFLLRQFFKSLPNELAEAAKIDGSGPFRTFFSIMLPLARPGLVAFGIFSTLWSCNELLWAERPLLAHSGRRPYSGP